MICGLRVLPGRFRLRAFSLRVDSGILPPLAGLTKPAATFLPPGPTTQIRARVGPTGSNPQLFMRVTGTPDDDGIRRASFRLAPARLTLMAWLSHARLPKLPIIGFT
ncbi:hypothetical protein D3C84_960870 [compost metagenome]